ncbi:hypothetical protein QTP88_015705 [Uroleucon formosanum]
MYFNYKGYYSVVLQGIFDANYKFIAIEVGAYAPSVLLGDDACPLKTNLLKPYSRKRLTIEERIFNYQLSRARRCVECAFGILLAKWRCLKTELQIDPDKVDIAVKCVCLLHNIIIDKEGLTSFDFPEVSFEPQHNVPISRRYNHYGRIANETRETLKNYFVSPAGKSLQQKWKNIRTSFSRKLKRRSGAKSGAAASRKISYIYFPQLQFLKETVQKNQTQASIDETEVVSNDEGGNVQIRSLIAKNKKKSDDDSLIEVLKESISLRENRERKQECDSDRLFMLSLLDDFRKIPEDRRLPTKMELLDVIKRAQPLRLEINNQSYSHSVPYIHRYGPEASSNIGQYPHEHSVLPNYGPGAFRSKQYHSGYSTQQNYGSGASSSGQNRSVFFTPISDNQNTTIVYDEGLSPTDSYVTTMTDNSEILDLFN